MKILIVTTVSVTMNFFKDQIKELCDKGYEVHLCTNFNDNSNNNWDSDLIKHHVDFSRSMISFENIKAYKQLKMLLASNEYDIIHTHTPIASALVRLQKNKNTRIIYTAHGFHFYKGAPKKNWLLFYPIEKILSRRTDDLITINSEDYELANKKFGMSKLHIINGPGVDIESTRNAKIVKRSELNLLENDFVLIFGAELNYNKNQYLLIDSMNELINKYSNFKLLLVGKDNYKGVYQKYVKDLKLENNIFFLGMRRDIKGIIKSCDLAVSSSKREGLGLFLIESGLNGLPIIATNNRGSREIIVNGVNGYLCEFDSEEFVKKIEDVYLNYEKFKKSNDLEMYRKFSNVSVNEKIFSIYES